MERSSNVPNDPSDNAELLTAFLALRPDYEHAQELGRVFKRRHDLFERRDDDMRLTGKRHAFRYDYEVGFDDNGRIRGLSLELASRCGFSADLSGPVNDRAMFHADNCYFIEHVAITSYRSGAITILMQQASTW